MLDKGYVQVYTGNGKGKTTAAMGVAARCALSGGRVYIAQFLKGQECGETHLPEKIDGIELCQFGSESFICGEPADNDIKMALEGMDSARKAMNSGKYDIIVLDEINCCMALGMIEPEKVADMIDSKPENVELILTGRGCPDEIMEKADLVTEMREVKHYFTEGIEARKGIEY